MDSTFPRPPSPIVRQPQSSTPAPTAAAVAPAASAPPAAPAAASSNRNVIGRVHAVSGAQVTVGLSPAATATDASKATVGKFLGILSSSSVIVGMITEIAER